MENKDLTEKEMECLYVKDRDGNPFIVEDNALDYLDERLEFARISVKTSIEDNDGKLIEAWIIALALNMNDVFYWACADLEFFSFADVKDIFNKCFSESGKFNRFGDMKWCCVKRNMRPQHEYIKLIKEAGLWDDEWESLPEREIDFANPDFDYPEKCKP